MITRTILHLEADWLRVPLWSLWYPLFIIPDFTIRALLCPEGRARIVQAECWQTMFAMYLIGLDGWKEYE